MELPILMFYRFEPVLYLDPVSKFPETTERRGHFVGFADNVGDKLTFKILKNDLSTILHRSVVSGLQQMLIIKTHNFFIQNF
jgi:hypothetical protein